MRKWTKCDERMPRHRQRVLVKTPSRIFEAIRDEAWKGGFTWGGGCVTGVTHWMPIPPPPEEEQDAAQQQEPLTQHLTRAPLAPNPEENPWQRKPSIS